ncbi:MAG: RDD family protein [Candidatus Acidiferrales bacterium]
MPRGNGSSSSTSSVQTAADAFALTPPVYFEHSPRHQQAQRRSVRRRAWGRRHRPPVNGNAVAVLPEDARWEAPPRFELIEMPLVQTAFDFPADSETERLPSLARIAPIERRLEAGLRDAGVILAAALLFFVLFALLGGELGVGRHHVLMYLAVTYSLAVVYFGLFTFFDGRTVGMRACGLLPLTFEGQPLTRQHKLWRAFGYGVSTGALLLGFFWAAADDRHLTWHDHISRTFLSDGPAL